ncbi:MAG: hypothetical protein LQ350_003657 [Teloschistes chrysophthalmus]|nr:MAG: hypothetical protein LQ350_003657 [Niorma chrysophthalma]
MSSSELSEISSSLSSAGDEIDSTPPRSKNLDHYFKSAAATKSSLPPKKKRPPSPPHEYVLADNPDIAFICMFRARFTEVFPKSLQHYGPQDIENGVAESLPSEPVERLLCAILGLLLNRKKDVERGHHQRALEEAIQTHNNQWPVKWLGKNPLHGGGNFNNMSPEGRLTLLTALITWSLGSSESVQNIIKEKYKQQRHDDDKNQPLSVQPWGRDGDKRRHWLIEGHDDTHFRLYRESNPALKTVTWRSVAGTIEELKQVAARLEEDGSQAARKLCDSINAAIPRFEAGEDKRKRREYRMARKAQFTRPEPGFSLYEGRTRGKRMKYTFSDEEDVGSDAPSTRRSNRQSGLSTPAEPARPTVTASGRQVRSRYGGKYGETMLSGQHDQEGNLANGVPDDIGEDSSTLRRGRTTRNSGRAVRSRGGGHNSEGIDDDSDVTSSGHEWDRADDDDEADAHVDERTEDDAMSEDISEEDELAMEEKGPPPRLVVALRYSRRPPAHAAAATKQTSIMPDPKSLSDQAPPPEANPFAAPVDDTTANPILSNGYTPEISGTTVPKWEHQALDDPNRQTYKSAPQLT